MIHVITGALLAFFAIVGFSESLKAAGDFLLRPDGGVKFIVTPGEHDEQVEYRIRSLVFRASSFTRRGSGPLIVVVDTGMDSETRKICELLQKELGCVAICRGDELPSLLDGKPGPDKPAAAV